MSKTTRIASASSDSGSPTASSTPLRSLAISEHSIVTGTPRAIRAWLMSSVQVSPANPSPPQGSAKGQPTNVTCGRPPGIPFVSFDPATHSWKTSLDLFPADILTRSSVTWPKSGMMHDGQCWERTILVPRISGTGSGYSLPTPSAVSYGTNQGGGMGRTGPLRPSLDTMARQNMWPTPSGHRRGGGSHSTQPSSAQRSQAADHPAGCGAVAEPQGQRLQGDGTSWQQEPNTRQPKKESERHNGSMGDTEHGRCDQGLAGDSRRQESERGAYRGKPNRPNWWATEPDVGRVAHGVAARVDRLRALGNGQVPAVATAAWRILTENSVHAACGSSCSGAKRKPVPV